MYLLSFSCSVTELVIMHETTEGPLFLAVMMTLTSLTTTRLPVESIKDLLPRLQQCYKTHSMSSL